MLTLFPVVVLPAALGLVNKVFGKPLEIPVGIQGIEDPYLPMLPAFIHHSYGYLLREHQMMMNLPGADSFFRHPEVFQFDAVFKIKRITFYA